MKEAPFCTLFFCEILVKFHQDAGCLGADGGACRVNGAVVVAVDQLVAVAQRMAASAQLATLPLSGNWERSPSALKS